MYRPAAVPSLAGARLLVSGLTLLALLPALTNYPAIAQVLFGSMVGNVTDASGAAVAGATAKITEVSTNDVHSVQANENGTYNAVNLPAGTYRIEISKEGFRTFAASNVLVNQNNVVRVDARLEVGAQTERIEVTAEAAALQTDRADVHAEVSNQVLETFLSPTGRGKVC